MNPLNQRFVPLDGLSQSEITDPNRTRTFEGDGGPHLEVPGILSVERVVIGRTELPMTEKRLYPINKRGVLQEVEEPLVDLQRRSDGMPILRRALISNDGIWPKGEKVYVTGDWENGEEDESDDESESEDVDLDEDNPLGKNGFDYLEPDIAEKLRESLPGTDEERAAAIADMTEKQLSDLPNITKAAAKKILAAFGA